MEFSTSLTCLGFSFWETFYFATSEDYVDVKKHLFLILNTFHLWFKFFDIFMTYFDKYFLNIVKDIWQVGCEESINMLVVGLFYPFKKMFLEAILGISLCQFPMNICLMCEWIIYQQTSFWFSDIDALRL